MAKNIILNILCEEDQSMSFEEACPSNWKWLSYMLAEGNLPQVDRADLQAALDEYVAELKKDQDNEIEWLSTVDKTVEQFKQRLNELVDAHDEDMGWVVCMAGQWSVEYDSCFGVMICIDKDDEEE